MRISNPLPTHAGLALLGILLGSIALPAAPLAAQMSFVLNPDGNYVPSYARNNTSASGPDAPGDLLRTYTLSNGSTLSGFAPRMDAPGQWCNLSGGNAEIFRTDINGVVDSTLAVTDVNDSWPGLDGTRNTLICVNAFDDTMSGYDASTGAPLFRFRVITGGPVGCTYDSRRDVYWYCDWMTNELYALDASGAQGGAAMEVSRFSVAPCITRIAGVTYDSKRDCLVVGGRDQDMQIAFDAAPPHAKKNQWRTQGASINDPQGCGLSPESGITTTDFQDVNTRVHEGPSGVSPGAFASGANVTIVNYANSESRALVGHSNGPGRDVIKGVLTSLSRQGIRNGGQINLFGNPPVGSTNIGSTGRAIQAGLLPSKILTNVVFN